MVIRINEVLRRCGSCVLRAADVATQRLLLPHSLIGCTCPCIDPQREKERERERESGLGTELALLRRNFPIYKYMTQEGNRGRGQRHKGFRQIQQTFAQIEY